MVAIEVAAILNSEDLFCRSNINKSTTHDFIVQLVLRLPKENLFNNSGKLSSSSLFSIPRVVIFQYIYIYKTIFHQFIYTLYCINFFFS